MFNSLPIFYLILFVVDFTQGSIENGFCDRVNRYKDTDDKCNVQSRYSRNRYILYDVNPPEGFNLRRDVYIRIAVFVRNLIEDQEFKWQLVLPPWGNLYHWRSKNVGIQTQLPWNLFFDIVSLQKYIPVIEMYQFLKEYPLENETTSLDVTYILQNDKEMFETGRFEDKNEIVECDKDSLWYHKLVSSEYSGYFWGYHNITSKTVKCIKFHGMVSNLQINLKPAIYRSIMFDRVEIALHDFYGSQEYWIARRSMRYNSKLYDIANEYRKIFLNSTDERDSTKLPQDWTKEKSRRNAIGGPYLSVHLRRRDFLIGRSSTVPTIKSAAFQLRTMLDKLKLKLLFVATDAPEQEFKELEEYLSDYTVLKYVPTNYIANNFKDGGIAIIDQIICSHARYFIGTQESTFTFRIQEDREIIGFTVRTTFNYIGKESTVSDTNGHWEIVW